jgi:hypothetical protein
MNQRIPDLEQARLFYRSHTYFFYGQGYFCFCLAGL